jgi:hypothetical protein
MDRQQIQVFLPLAEQLHFARTAERLRLACAGPPKAGETAIPHGCAGHLVPAEQIRFAGVGAVNGRSSRKQAPAGRST